jgi:hypothetical protein
MLIARWAGPPANRRNLTTLESPARDKLNLPSALVNLALAGSLYASWKSKYADCAAIGSQMARLFLERAKRDGLIRRADQLNEIQSNR